MATLVDSEAHFGSRCKLIGLDDSVYKELQKLKLDTIGRFAYAVGQPGVLLAESDWQSWLSTTVPGTSVASAACLRRLLFEAQTILLADLKQQVQNPSETKPVPEAERERRMTQLRASVPGVIIEGDSEPSKALLDVCINMTATAELKYVPPCKCTSRLHEVSLAAPSSKLVELEASRLIVRDKVEVPDTQVSTPIQLLEALKRRGLAFQFADICSFVEHERYVGRLMKHLTKPVLEGTPRCTVAQIIEADRLVHVHLLEQGVKPRRNASGVREVEANLAAALGTYEVAFSLIPQHKPANPPPGQGNKKRKRQEWLRKVKEAKQQRKEESPYKGKGKGKGATKGAKVPKAILDLGGVAQMPDGSSLCFGYSLGQCKMGPKCNFKHACARCFGPRPIKDCPLVKAT